MAFNTDSSRVDRLVGLKIIENAAGTPRPGSQGAPVIKRSRLAMIDESDDPGAKTFAIVRLDSGVNVHRISPALGEYLLLPSGPGLGMHFREAFHERGPYFR